MFSKLKTIYQDWQAFRKRVSLDVIGDKIELAKAYQRECWDVLARAKDFYEGWDTATHVMYFDNPPGWEIDYRDSVLQTYYTQLDAVQADLDKLLDCIDKDQAVYDNWLCYRSWL